MRHGLAGSHLLLSALVAGLTALAALPLQAETLVFHASTSGKQTLDQGEGGGNPFASALIDLLNRQSLKLSELPSALQRLTFQKSRGFQMPDVPSSTPLAKLSLVPTRDGQQRTALVLVVSDYRKSGGAQSLPGAKHDAYRIAGTLRQAGFKTKMALDLSLTEMRKELASFRRRSMNSDLSVIYTTGHGVEVDGTVYLIPGDYPINERNQALTRRALALPEIAHSTAGRVVNLVFYAGCRDDPLGH